MKKHYYGTEPIAMLFRDEIYINYYSNRTYCVKKKLQNKFMSIYKSLNRWQYEYMPTLYQLSYLGHPILRQKAKPIKNPKSKEIKKLVADMIATVEEFSGVGLAAPQVYQPLQLFIMSWEKNPKYPGIETTGPIAIMNPKIISASKKKDKDWEGCLSLPGVRGNVPRHSEIKVSYTNLAGKRVTTTFKSILARIFQHEYDHLQGIMFTDQTKPADLISDKEYFKMTKKKK